VGRLRPRTWHGPRTDLPMAWNGIRMGATSFQLSPCPNGRTHLQIQPQTRGIHNLSIPESFPTTTTSTTRRRRRRRLDRGRGSTADPLGSCLNHRVEHDCQMQYGLEWYMNWGCLLFIIIRPPCHPLHTSFVLFCSRSVVADLCIDASIVSCAVLLETYCENRL
jgi:hypothetical protein